MATRIRLQRHGKKGKPFYHIVAADQRSKRDGRYIERIGSYNPNVNPAVIDLDFDRAVYWLGVGAQPSDTAKAILSYKGAVYKNHLLKGVAKGALTEDQADKKFNAWLADKEGKIQAKKDNLSKAADKEKSERLATEKAISDERAKLYAAAEAELASEAAAATEAAAAAIAAEEAPAAEEASAEAPTEEAPAAEEASSEAPAAEEKAAEPVAEAKEEAPAEEAKEEAPAAEEEKPEAKKDSSEEEKA